MTDEQSEQQQPEDEYSADAPPVVPFTAWDPEGRIEGFTATPKDDE